MSGEIKYLSKVKNKRHKKASFIIMNEAFVLYKYLLFTYHVTHYAFVWNDSYF